MKLIYYRDTAGEHRWKLVARNGKIVGSSSEGFSTRKKAKDNYDKVRSYSVNLVVEED